LLLALQQLGAGMEGSVAPASARLLARLAADPGSPLLCWSTAELARRLRLNGPPAVAAVVEALRAQGHQALASGVMAGQLRTDAPYALLLQSCRHLGREDR
jgi:N2,N2-dimethylguanosine tRNA methyltransferase